MNDLRVTKDSEVRKNELIAAAEKLFSANGIANTAVSAIVKEVNVAQGLFYYYFKSKDDVIDAIVEKYEKQFAQTLNKDLMMNSYEEDLDKFIANVTKAFNDLWTNFDEDKLETIINKSLKQTKQEASKIFQAILEEGVAEEKIELQDPKIYADIIISGISDLIYQGLTQANQIKDVVEELLANKRRD